MTHDEFHRMPFTIGQYMVSLGFRLVDTGGNCQVWRLDVDKTCYLVVSTNEGNAYADMDVPEWIWVRYFHDRPDGAGGNDLTLEGAAMWCKAHRLALYYQNRIS